MGVSSSSKSITEPDKQMAIDLVKKLITTPNVHFASVLFACGRLFILIGEDHERIDLKDYHLIKLMRDVCGKVQADLFIEDTHVFRKDFRFRTLSKEETVSNINEMQKEGNSLDIQRVAAQQACDTFRVHAVDVRDQGFIKFAYEAEELIKDAKIRSRIYTLYSISLHQNLEYVLSLTRSSIKKGFEESKQVSRQNASTLTHEIMPVVNTHDLSLQALYDAYSKLVDIYLFPRMCRLDNSNVCFFYGGFNHAKRTSACVEQLPDVETLFSFLRPE
jgi:hypothetical protein